MKNENALQRWRGDTHDHRHSLHSRDHHQAICSPGAPAWPRALILSGPRDRQGGFRRLRNTLDGFREAISALKRRGLALTWHYLFADNPQTASRCKQSQLPLPMTRATSR